MDTAVSTAASAFTTQFTADLGLIAAALIGAAFLAVGVKWAKAAIFS